MYASEAGEVSLSFLESFLQVNPREGWSLDGLGGLPVVMETLLFTKAALPYLWPTAPTAEH